MRNFSTFQLFIICLLGMNVFTNCHSDKTPNIYIATSQLALRQSPSGQGKFLSDIMVGEQVTMLDSTMTDTALNRPYCKVELSDKKQGWTLENGLLPLSKLGVIMTNLPLYKRPQESTQLTEKSNVYQLILFDITQVTDSFIPITSMYGTPIGWIQQKNMGLNISTNIDDVFTVLHLVSKKLIKYTNNGTEITDVAKLQTLQSEFYEKRIQSNIINNLLPSYDGEIVDFDKDSVTTVVQSESPFVEEN